MLSILLPKHIHRITMDALPTTQLQLFKREILVSTREASNCGIQASNWWTLDCLEIPRVCFQGSAKHPTALYPMSLWHPPFVALACLELLTCPVCVGLRAPSVIKGNQRISIMACKSPYEACRGKERAHQRKRQRGLQLCLPQLLGAQRRFN